MPESIMDWHGNIHNEEKKRIRGIRRRPGLEATFPPPSQGIQFNPVKSVNYR